MLIKPCSRLLECLSIIPAFQVVNEAWGGSLQAQDYAAVCTAEYNPKRSLFGIPSSV